MPELPEVEILKNQLNERVKGKKIVDVSIPHLKRWPDFPAEDFKAAVTGGVVERVERKGKMLLIGLDNGNSLLIHLMMAGQIIQTDGPARVEKNNELILPLSDGSRLWINNLALQFVHFGTREQVETLPQLEKLGVDPCSETFTLSLFKEKLRRRRGQVKSLLLNQGFIAGLGSIYGDELLFNAGIRPDRGVDTLSDKEKETLYHSIRQTLQQGLDAGGASEFAFVQLDGSEGSFQEHFKVNRRQGKPCLECGTAIEKIKISGRGTYFCPGCQH